MTEQKHALRVADWSETPGHRYRSSGSHSGEEYLEDELIPAFERALAEDAVLHVDLDGGYGYAPGFLEETFGGLARKYGSVVVQKHIAIKTDEEPRLEKSIRKYIADVALHGDRT